METAVTDCGQVNLQVLEAKLGPRYATALSRIMPAFSFKFEPNARKDNRYDHCLSQRLHIGKEGCTNNRVFAYMEEETLMVAIRAGGSVSRPNDVSGITFLPPFSYLVPKPGDYLDANETYDAIEILAGCIFLSKGHATGCIWNGTKSQERLEDVIQKVVKNSNMNRTYYAGSLALTSTRNSVTPAIPANVVPNKRAAKDDSVGQEYNDRKDLHTSLMNGTLGNQNEPERPIDEVENLKTEKEELGQQLMGVTKELDSVKEKAEQYKQKLQYHADIDDTIKTFKEKWHSSLLSIRKK